MTQVNRPQTVGEAVVRLLERYGVDTAFGIPGVHTVEFYRGLGNSPIRHVLTRHEQGAGFMADGYARATGKPGVCFVISGPGVTNIMTPMGQAYSDSVPMLVISSVIASGDIGRKRGRLHEMSDQHAAAATVSAFSATAMSPDDLPDLIARAFAQFGAGRPRPVHIEIPIDVLKLPVEEDWQPAEPETPAAPAADAIDAAARRLAQAKRPVILAGGGACNAAARVQQLAERLGATVIPTVAGKGIIADDHPLCLGPALPQDLAQEFLAAADVVLAVGTELAMTDFWRDRLDMNGALIRIDIDPVELRDDHEAEIPILADAGAALAAISTRLDQLDGHGAAEDVRPEIAALRERIVEAESPLRTSHRRVLEVVRDALPDDAIVSSDMTQIAYSSNEIFPVSQVRSWFHPVGFGTLGYAVPAAVGARLGAPGRPVAALVGDYGFMFTAQELSVAVELGLPVIVLLWNNTALSEIHDNMQRNDVPPVAVKQINADFQLLGKAFGCHTTQPDSLAQLSEDIGVALAANGPSLIEIRPEIV